MANRSSVCTLLPLLGLLAVVSTTTANLTSLSNLSYDGSGKLRTHLLVYPELCRPAIVRALGGMEPYGRVMKGVAGDALVAFFGETDEEYANRKSGFATLKLSDCRAACVERGVDRSVVHGVMPIYRFEGNAEERAFDAWFLESCEQVEFGFVNYHLPDVKRNINAYWVDSYGNRHSRGQIGWGENNTYFFKTYLGHKWLFEDPDTKKVLLEHVVEFTGVRSIGQHPSLVDLDVDFTEEIENSLVNEWSKHNIVKRTFTKLGFGRGRLPDDVFASMAAYCYNNNDYRALEEWTGGKGVFVNWWEKDVFFVQAPWDLRRVWQTRIKDLVEKWSNTDLENTSIYGFRRYEEGARLLSHVDRVNTHAASVIINVAQGNISKPWTIEVYDHADRLHEVVMEPGDIVYYESAKCLHGRNTPLQGKGAYYVNMFSHYRPVGDPEWYKRPNPEGAPEPVVDVGECRLVGSLSQYSQGAVQCDNPAIGPHLSPSMTKATSGADLFDWWRNVGPDLIRPTSGEL